MATIAIMTATVTVRKPKWRMIARLENQSGKPTICSPLVMMLAMPRAIDIIASVAMKAGMLRRVIISPETAPQSADAMSAATIAIPNGHPRLLPR